MDHKYIPNLFCLFGCFKPKLPAAPPTAGRKSVATPPPTTKYIDELSVCYECRQVKWSNLVDMGEDLLWGVMRPVVRTIGASHEQLITSPCSICNILAVIRPQSLDGTDFVVRAQSLFSFRHTYAIPYLWSKCETTALDVCRRASITEENKYIDRCLAVIKSENNEDLSWGNDRDISPRTITPRLIDFDWLMRLAQLCEENHEESCWPGSGGAVSGLKVIETSSRTVIEAPSECRYVALSYVWGKQPDVTHVATTSLQNPPPLIEDALSVTTSMGYNYLWVDRYCISQEDPQERHHMISQMGQIYANSSLTIVDASGGDAQSGIPGVSSSRLPQKCVYNRDTAILELPCGEHELNCSKWATRGWTYQEGYLSNRRIIFTQSQVLFLCNQSYAEESVCRLSQEVVTQSNTTRFVHFINPKLNYRQEERHTKMLKEYSKRDLTYAADSLHAFLGVLNFDIQRSRSLASSMLHISCGLVAQSSRGSSAFLRVYLNWYHEHRAIRRPEFPSWSWAGWGGPLKFDDATEGFTLHKRGNGSLIPPRFEWEISWKSRDHKSVTIWQFVNDYWSTSYNTDELQLSQQPDHPKCLEITCFVVPIRFQVVSQMDFQGVNATMIHFEKRQESTAVNRRGLAADFVPVLQFVEGVHIATRAKLDQDVKIQDHIVGLMYAEGSEAQICIGCVLARRLTKGVFERVGAIPRLLYCSRQLSSVSFDFPDSAFLDDNGSILYDFRVSETQERLLFSGIGKRKTVSLV